MKQQIIDTMVSEKLTHLDDLYNSVKHLDGVGKCSDYDETGLLALVAQLISLTHQPIDKQKVQGVPTNKTSRKGIKYSEQRVNNNKQPQNTNKPSNSNKKHLKRKA